MNIKFCIPTFQERFLSVHAAVKEYFTDKHGQVLDLGCGEGENAFELAKNFSVTAIDINADDIKYCRFIKTIKKTGTVAFLCKDAAHTELPDNSMDFAICTDVLEHVPRPDAIITELFRVLKPRGRAIITVPSENYPWTYDPLNALLKIMHVPFRFPFGAHGYGHTQLPKPADIKDLLQAQGFTVLKEQKLTSYLAGLCELYWASLLQKCAKRNASNRENTLDGTKLTRGIFIISSGVRTVLKPVLTAARMVTMAINRADRTLCAPAQSSVGILFVVEKKGEHA